MMMRFMASQDLRLITSIWKMRLFWFKALCLIFLYGSSFYAFSDIQFIGAEKKSYTNFIEYAQKVSKGSLLLEENIYVSFGSDGLKKAIEYNYTPVIAVYITKSEFDHVNSKSSIDNKKIGAIFWEASPDKYISLVDEIFEYGNFYILTSSKINQSYSKRVRVIEYSDENIIRNLEKIKSDASAVIALPDRKIYTPKNLRTIIRYLYAKNIPLIGYSRSMVSAGSLISINHEPIEYSKQLIDEIILLQSGKTPREIYSKNTKIHKNKRLARSLGINFPINLDDNFQGESR